MESVENVTSEQEQAETCKQPGVGWDKIEETLMKAVKSIIDYCSSE